MRRQHPAFRMSMSARPSSLSLPTYPESRNPALHPPSLGQSNISSACFWRFPALPRPVPATTAAQEPRPPRPACPFRVLHGLLTGAVSHCFPLVRPLTASEYPTSHKPTSQPGKVRPREREPAGGFQRQAVTVAPGRGPRTAHCLIYFVLIWQPEISLCFCWVMYMSLPTLSSSEATRGAPTAPTDPEVLTPCTWPLSQPVAPALGTGGHWGGRWGPGQQV